jgi:thiamine biosynthesis lipoprotein
MGTTYAVKLGLLPGIDAKSLEPAIAAELEEVDALMSTWREDSELSRLNRHPVDEPFAVSPSTLEVLELALSIGERSGGAFDVSVGPLVDAWGFGPAPDPQGPPADDLIAAMLEATGQHLLSLDAAAATATRRHPQLRLDLSAIAKGHAVDRVAARLAQLGCVDFMVEVGGEVKTSGRREDGAPWRIAIEAPRVGTRTAGRVLALTDVALATSGDYRNFWEHEGRRYSHTLDPRTGRPVTHSLASVSVAHRSAAAADAWATALLVLGPDAGPQLASELGLAALFQAYSGDGVSTQATPAFDTLFGDEPLD